ncbi:MAG TPA: hypothetical protein VIQ74_14215 [Gemmatimonadaceae bacterium]
MQSYIIWKVVFDASTDRWQGLRFGTIMLGGALLISLVGAFYDKLNQRKVFSTKTRYVTGFVLVCAILSLVGGYSRYRDLRGALERGEYQVVEGVVDRFVPATEWGSWESFVVSDHRYEYSDPWVVPGYHRTASNGGVIRNGLHVRIADVDGEIARLEVPRR